MRSKGMFVMPGVVLALATCTLFAPADYDEANPVAIEILNHSFEDPANLTGTMQTTDAWTCGGTWFGRWAGPAAKDGLGVAWASFGGGGAENGYSQELASAFRAGHYRLSIWINADGRDLVSRAIIGYDRGDNDYAVLESDDTISLYGHEPDTAWKDRWTEQVVELDVRSRSPAVGKAIWIRFTNTTVSSPQLPTDTESYGNSVSWDCATLNYFAYLE